MLFNSFVFIFVFLPLTLIGYFTLNHFKKYDLAKVLLIIASLYFYAFFNWSYLPIIANSIIINYLIGSYLQIKGASCRKAMLALGVTYSSDASDAESKTAKEASHNRLIVN